MESFHFAARLKLDTFSFNRLCAYRGTPLWQEYIDRRIIDDERDWYKWFKCSDIDPTVLRSAVVNRVRMKGYTLLFARRIFGRPIQTYHLLRTLSRHMEMSDVITLIWSPFRRRKLTHKPDFPANIIELELEEPVRK
jgi:anaerobic magnesium-protoporphyrin IX monomethyl ester cyclase